MCQGFLERGSKVRKAVTLHSRNEPDIQKEWWEDYEYRAQYESGHIPQFIFSLPYAFGKKLVVTEDKDMAMLLESALDTLLDKQKEANLPTEGE